MKKINKEKLYKINESYYLNPYIAICCVCDTTFKTERQAFNHANKNDHSIYWCEEFEK